MAGQVISRLTSSGGDDAGVHVISSSFYGTCSSAANSENKVVIIQNRNVEQVNLTKGMLLTVKFTNKNDYSESLPSLQLFKNEAAPDSVPIIGSALTTPMTIFAQQNSNIKPNWSAGSVVTFIYDTYIKQNQDGTTSTLGCWIKTAGLSEEIFDNLNIRIDNVESASTIAISGVTDRVNSIESNITQAAVVGDIEFIYWPIDSTTTPPVTPAASYDWEETFNVNCEWNTDALPYVFGLDIWQRTKSFTIGNASNPTYSDPIRITGRDGAKGDKGDQGDPGATGSPAYSYDLITDVTSLIRNVNTNPVINNPSTITFSATKTEGNNAPTPYLEGKLTVSEYIYDTNESKWKWNVLENKTSFSVSNQSITVTPSIVATSVMGILFASDGTTELDKQTIPIIETGRNGLSVTVDSIQYGTSETEAATPQSWNASIPTTITPGWWLWTRTSYVGVATPAISKSYIGTDGEDGTSVTIQSISKDEGTTTVILNNGDGTTAALIIEDGTDGENGQQGPAGYIHTAWANGIGQTAQDFIDFSRTNENNLTYLYMGVYTDNEEEDSNDPLDYSWTLIKGEDGNDAIVAYLTNESGSFAATSSAAVTASVSSQFVINKGGQTLTATIKNITPDPISSLPAYNAGALTVTSANDTFTIGINPNFTTTAYQHNGSFEITASATVNGISQDFTKDFSWVLVPAGVDGTNGTNGFNFANIRLYQIANQPPEKPRNDLIYTFNNQTLTPTSALNGWSIDMPDMTSVTPGLSCYLISANAASLESTDVIKGTGINESEEDQSDWYGPIVYVQNGKDGLDAYNHASISLYQRSLTEPTEPTNPINYTFSTGTLTPSTSLGNWTTGVTAATNGEPCWVITANAISKNETYTITDWSNPAIFTQDGADGEGISITNREIHYVESNSGTVTPSDSASWNTNIPTVAEGNYLWTRTKIAYSDGNVLTSYSVAKQGKSITVTGSSIQYATNNSTTTPTSGWQSSPPTTTPGWYIWTKTTTNYSDESSVVSYSVSKTGTNGSNAYLYELHCDPSVITIDQNVQTPAFAPAAISLSATRTNGNNTPAAYNGRFKLEWTSDNNTWTPIYNGTVNESSKNCSIANVSTAATSFKATLYATGGNSNTLDTETIPVIRGGKNGINGYNQSTVYLYKRSDTQPTAPSNNHTYNFANKTFTDATSDKIENWTINKMPAADGDKIAWMTFAVASSTTSTDEIVSTEWSTPVKIEGVDGTDGYNQTVVQLYQRYNSQNENDTPTKPANNSLTYTFSTNRLTGNGLGNWSQQIPAPNGSPCWITVGVARSQSNSDVIDSWSDPTIYNKDGADGYNKATVYLYQRATSAPNRPSEELIYTFNTQGLTPTPGSTSGNNFLNNWSQTIPSDSTNPLWMIAAVANNTAVSDSILATEWSVPTKMEGVDGQPGQPGQPGANGYNQATIDLYKRADSAPTSSSMPGTLTYTFGATNPLSNPANGWSQTIPTTNGQPCWVTSGIAISQNTSATISNWSTPTKILEDPINVVIDNDNVTFPTTNGAATKTTVTCNIKAFKGLTQVPCTIGSISGAVTGIATSKTNGTTTTPTAKVTITASNTTSTLLTTEQGTLTIPITISGVANSINKQFTWSLAKNGLNQATLYLYKRADSATKPTSGNDSVYNFTNKTLTNIPSGWSTTFPAETQGSTTPVWVMTAVASSNTNTDNIAYTEWSTPVKYVSSGSNGQPGKDGKDAYNQADVFLYRRATSAITPVFANNSITYTFSTGINGLNSSYNTNTSPAITWYTSVTAATNSQNDYMPCWMSSVHPISQNASVDISSNWSAPTIYIQPGIGIKNVVDYYVATSSTNVTINNTDWVVPDEGADPPIHMPQIDSTNKYLWNYEVTTYTDNTTRTINPHIVATYGRDGTNITITSIQYGTSNSAATEPTNWSSTAPTSIGTGKWVWVKTTYSNNSTSINKSYVGTNGTNGQPGTSSYTHIAWANSADGKTDFSKTSSTNKTYLGICVNNTQSDSSLVYSNYTWSLIQGKSVVSIVNKYKLTETLNRPAITDTGWVEPNDNTPIPTVSSTNKYLWTYEITTYANPSDTATTQPHLIGAYGDKGIGVQDIIEQAILWEYDDSDLETHPAPANNRNDWQPRESIIWESGKYIWVRTKIIWTEGDPTYIGPELAKNDNNIGEQLDRNVLTKSGSGNIITTDDCAPLPPIGITVYGKSTQDGTPSPSSPVPIQSVEGRNLFSLSAPIQTMQGCTYSVDGDSITITATTTNAWPYVRWKVPLNGTSATLTVQSMTAGGQAYLQLLDANDSVLATSSALRTDSGYVTLDQTGAVSAYVILYSRTTAAGSVGDTATLSNVMLQDGAVVHRFVPYGAIPISVSGKNLLNTSITEATYAGVTYTQGNRGEIVLNGTKYGGGYYVVKQDAFSLQAGTYTFSAELVSGTATATPTIYLLGNNDAVVFQVTPNAGSKKSHTVTLAEDTNIIKLRFGLFTDNSVYTNATYALQLEIGSTATPYTQSENSQIRINMLGKLPAVTPPRVSIGNGNYITTDSYEDFTKDFCLFVDFVRASTSRHCFASPYNSLPGVGIELNASGQVRVYSVSDTGVVTDKALGTAVGINSQCRFALMWTAATKTYTWLSVHDGLRETGTFAASGTYTGTSTNPLRMGGDFRDATGGKSTFPTSWIQWNINPYYEGVFPDNYAMQEWYYNGSDYSWTPFGGFCACSLPNGEKDYITIEDGRWKLHKVSGKVVLDGLTNTVTFNLAATSGGTGNRFLATLPDDMAVITTDQRRNFISDRFSYGSGKATVSSQWTPGDAMLYPYNNANAKQMLLIFGASETTTALGNTWLQSNPVTVIYPLAQEQIIDLGVANLPNLPSPDMSMWVDGTTIDATWWTQYGYETGRAKLDIISIQKEVTNTQTSLEKTVVETNQWWFITDRYDNFNLLHPEKIIGYTEDTPPEAIYEGWPHNNQTGEYDNWVLKIPDPYVTFNSNDLPNRYTFSKNDDIIKIEDAIIKDNNNNNRDVTNYCIIKENERENEEEPISYLIQKYYPHNYYCYEYKYMDGSIEYSDVIYDSVKSAIAQNKLVEEKQNEILRQMIESQRQFFYSDTNGAHVKDLDTEYRTDWNSFGMTFWKQDAKLLAILASPDSEGLYSGMTIYNGKTGFDEQNNPREKVVAKFTPGLIQLGSDKDSNRLSITPSAIRFIKDSTAAAYIENSQFYTPNITIDSSLYLETPKESIESQNANQEYKWAWIPRSNGNVSFKWVGKL